MTAGRAGSWIAFHAILGALALAVLPRLRSDVRPHVFLGSDDPVRIAHDRFQDQFGTDSFVLVSCRPTGGHVFGTQATDMRLAGLAEALRGVNGVESVHIPESGAPLTRELALRDEKSLRVSLLVAVDPGQPGLVAGLRRVAAGFPDLHPGLAGQPVLNRVLREASDQVGQRLFPLLAAAMLLLLWIAYRSPAIVAAVALTAGVVVLHGMAIVALLGRPINLVTILLPVLLLSLTVALCIHLVNAFRRRRAGGDRIGPAISAVRRAELRPCLVTTLTTAAGFGSFCLSRVEPLRVLGVAMAASILLSFVVGFTLLLALLRVTRPRPSEGLRIESWLTRWVPACVARPRVVLAVSLTIVAAAVAAASSVPRETNGLNYLPTGHPLRVETSRLMREGLGTASLELVLHAPPGGTARDLAGPVRELERRLRSAEDIAVRGLISPLTLAREIAFKLGAREARGLETAVFSPLFADVEASVRPFRDPDAGAARISIRIDPTSVDAYRVLRSRVEEEVGAALAPVPGARAELTGEYPIIMTVQGELLRTLLLSLLGTAGTILLVLAVAQRSILQAMLTLLPAVLPLACLVLVCAVAGIPLSVSTVMVMAVTLGVVTDDSVHMQHAWSRGLSLRAVLHRVGTAVTETSIAILMGFAVLTGAAFRPTAEFGLLTAIAMLVALAADLVLFPVLLGWSRGVRGRRRESSRPCAIPLEAMS